MDAEHGYWVNLEQSGYLVIDGAELPLDTPIQLEQGWNLVGYLPQAPLPVPNALASIAGKYDKLLGYSQGATSFYTDLPPQLNTLNIMERGKGYWIHMMEPGTLDYSQATAPTARSLTALNYPQASVGTAATNEWINVYSTNSTYNGQPLSVGTVVTAVGEDAPPIRICGGTRDGLVWYFGSLWQRFLYSRSRWRNLWRADSILD